MNCHFSLPGISLALGHLSCSSKPSWPSGWPARAKVFAKVQEKSKNFIFFLQRFTFSDHSLAVTALHCGYGPAPLARVFTASLDQVLCDVKAPEMNDFICIHISGVSHIQPDKR